MKKLLLLLSFVLVLSSCSKDNLPLPEPEASITLADGSSPSGDIDLGIGGTATFSAKCENVEAARYEWRLDGVLKSIEKTYTFTAEAPGTYTVALKVLNADQVAGEEVSLKIVVLGPYKNGTYILMEGNMSSDNGSICFIDGNGTYYTNPYGEANLDSEGKPTSPGNVLQDMFIYKDNAYFITQNGTSQGQGARLVITDAQTLKVKKLVAGSIDDSAVWPQHIVVIDENKAYIRYSTSDYEQNSGIRVMDLSTGVWGPAEIEGTYGQFTVAGSTKARLLLLGDKVFAPCGQYLKVIDTKTDKVVKSIDFGASRQTKDIAKGHDGNIYLLVSGKWTGSNYSPTYTTEAVVVCINPRDYTYTEKVLPSDYQMPVATWSPNVGMCASFTEDALFFRMGAGFSTSAVARYDYKTGTATKLLDTSTEADLASYPYVYGYLGVDPDDVLYVGTTNYSTSSIATYNAKTGARLEKTYNISSGSPTGIDFTYRFSDEYLERQ